MSLDTPPRRRPLTESLSLPRPERPSSSSSSSSPSSSDIFPGDEFVEWGDAVENVKQRPSDIEEDERVAGDTFSAGTLRMIHGLRNDTELNGQQVEILSYNSAKCRYVVRDGNGRTVSVKAQNLVQPCRECLPGWLHGVPFTL